MTILVQLSHSSRLLVAIAITFIITCTLAPGVVHADELTATVDRNSISLNESVQLNIRYTGRQNTAPPNFNNLEDLFDIVSNNQSNQFVNRNGQITSFTEWQLTLIPKKEGKLLIPAFNVNGTLSQPLVVNVSSAAQNPAAAQRDVYLETSIETDPIYVQQQLVVTYRLYFTKSIKGVDSTPFDIPDAIVEELPTRQFTRNINGREFRVAEVRYAVFPQTSGTLEIPSLNWDIRVATNSRINSIYGLSGRYEMRRERTEAKSIEVQPQPAEFPANAVWIPATNVNLEQTWSNDPNTFTVGEPITRTITLNAQGLMSSQLPKLIKESTQDEIKIYTEQPTLNDEQGDDGMHSSRIESAAVIVSQNGKTTLPVIRIPWWDVKSNTLKYAEIPAQEVVANGAVSNAAYEEKLSSNTTDTSTDNTPETPSASLAKLNLWRLLAIVFGLLSLVFVSLWLRLLIKNKQSRSESESSIQLEVLNHKTALDRIDRQCRAGNVDGVRDALLHWAALHWPNHSITTLQQLQFMIDDTNIKQALRNLDKDIYSGNTEKEFEANKFYTQLKQWLEQEKSRTSNATQLQAFYATQG